ncbi:methyltransferase domain-containing protein [Candidatus Woesearchaeota archaeon]|nr:methyltransferase domain-containing protein [Candidatus Woesearchaeota archaeon]
MDVKGFSDEKIKEHYRSTYFYDGTRQARHGKAYERYWFTRRIREITRDLRPFSRGKVLEIGCGTGAITEGVASALPNLDITATDISPQLIKKCREYYPHSRVKYEVADAFKLNYRENSFDAVIAVEVIEHVLDHKAMIKEAARVLKPGGIIIIDTPYKFHPLWKLEWLRRILGTDKGGDYRKGGKHFEPVHFSFSASDLKKILPEELVYLRHKQIALGITLHLVARKSLSQ